MRKTCLSLALLVAIVSGLLAAPPPAAAQREAERCFPETGYCIKGVFRRYWEQNGGLQVFGYPIAAQANEKNPADGKTYLTQWFERHRMEYHPENAGDPNYYILLGFLGKELYQRSRSTPVGPDRNLQGGCRPVEGQPDQVCGRFRAYWDRFGLSLSGENAAYRSSLALHGVPISPVVQTSIEGRPYQVQWFERARFEWHGPGSVANQPIGDYDVLFGLLGSLLLPRSRRTANTPPGAADRDTMDALAGGPGQLDYEGTAPVPLESSGAGPQQGPSRSALQAPAGVELLVPPAAPPPIEPEALAADPAALDGAAIGGLRTEIERPGLPAGLYAVTLRDDGQALRLIGAGGLTADLPATVRALPAAYPTPAATVAALPGAGAGSRQICYAWGRAQLCGLLPTFDSPRDQGLIREGLAALGLGPAQADERQALPLVAGAEQLDQCARAFSRTPPDYRGCPAAVVAAPAAGPRALRPDAPEPDLGLVVVRADLGEEVFGDPGLRQPLDRLPAGFYVAEAVALPDDPALPGGASVGRVRLSGPAGEFFLPAVLGVAPVGAPLLGQEPGAAQAQIAVGTSLRLREACFFKVSACAPEAATPLIVGQPQAGADLVEPPPPPAGGDLGVNSHIASRAPSFDSLGAAAAAVGELGVGWAREDFQFARIAPERGRYDWSWHDEMVRRLGERGVQIVGVLNLPSPEWATGQGDPSAPPDPKAFAEFAAAAAARYRGRIQHWQVWNEPDNPRYWPPEPDPAAYAALLRAAYPAIKGANPEARVLAAGLVSPQPAVEFLRQLHAAGAWGAFDIIALNPYVDPLSPEGGQIGLAGVGAVRGLAATLGPKPIWATELGWSTGPADRTAVSVDERTQARYLARGMAALRAAGVERAFWYALKDTRPDANLYGLVRYDQAGGYDAALRKESFTYLRVLAQQLAGAGPAGELALAPEQVLTDFERFGPWRRGDQPNGSFAQSAEQARSGRASGKLSYSFPRSSNDFVVFTGAYPLPDATSKLGVWVYGDGSGHALKVWLSDSQGEVFQYRLGPVGGPGWSYLVAGLNTPGAPVDLLSGEGNRRLDPPIQLSAIVLDDDPDSVSGAGAIYLDDLTATVGAESYGLRFARGGEVVDMLWAPRDTPVTIATRSGSVTRVSARGEATAEPASGGQYRLIVGPDPVYLRHAP